MRFNEVIHHNRDENSFTARIFEGYLVPLWAKDPSAFQQFIRMLALESGYNHNLLQQKYGQTWVTTFHEKTACFSDSMLFLENMDIYGYCKDKRNSIDLKIDADEVDKTEFDCVVVMDDELGNEDILVFEVKCFTDLHIEEIVRQNCLLQKYKDAGLFSQFYHFAMLSAENIERGSVFKKMESLNSELKKAKLDAFLNGIFIISWTGIMNYIDHYASKHAFPRFIKEIEFQELNKSISIDGQQKYPRRLISGRK